jgi:hypothetical protein
VTATVVTIAGCASVKELEVTAPLAPMPQPLLRPGYAETVIYNGQERVILSHRRGGSAAAQR